MGKINSAQNKQLDPLKDHVFQREKDFFVTLKCGDSWCPCLFPGEYR